MMLPGPYPLLALRLLPSTEATALSLSAREAAALKPPIEVEADTESLFFVMDDPDSEISCKLKYF